MTTEAETTVDPDDSAGTDAELAAWNEDDAGSTRAPADADARTASGTAANAPATSGAPGAKGAESGAGKAEKKTALQLAEERAASKHGGTTSPAASDGGSGPAQAAAAASGTEQTTTAKTGEHKKAGDPGQGQPAADPGSLSDRIKAAVKSVLETHKDLILADPSPEDANATTTLANLHAEIPAITQLIALHTETARDAILSQVREDMRALLGGDEAGGGVQQLREQLQAVQEQLGRQRLFGALRSEEYGMPDAERIVEDPKFGEWLGKQTPGMQGLAYSPDPEDAVALLRAYKESTGTKSAANVNRRSIRSSRAAAGDGRVHGGEEVDLEATFDQTEV
jgi:hypothetical protein